MKGIHERRIYRFGSLPGMQRCRHSCPLHASTAHQHAPSIYFPWHLDPSGCSNGHKRAHSRCAAHVKLCLVGRQYLVGDRDKASSVELLYRHWIAHERGVVQPLHLAQNHGESTVITFQWDLLTPTF